MAGAKPTLVALSAVGLLLTGNGIAEANTMAEPTSSYLWLDHTLVKPGEQVHVIARCGAGELLNLVGSEAFAPTGEDGPYAGNGGVTKFTARLDDGAEGEASIRTDIAPGSYHVAERCGGGYAGGLDLMVLGD